jgi:PAS domain S-box-containing protein
MLAALAIALLVAALLALRVRALDARLEDSHAATARAARDADHAQAELAEERAFFQAVLDRTSDVVVACDAAGRLRAVAGSEPLPDGTDPLDWAERLQLAGTDGAPLAAADVPLFRALQGETFRGAEVVADGRHVSVAGAPVLDESGRRLGALIVGADVTERRAVEEDLRASAARWAGVLAGVRDIVFETDMAGRWTVLSDGWEGATGIPVDAALGRGSWERVHPDDRPAQARAFSSLVAGREEFVAHRHRYVTTGGTVRWAEARAQLRRDGRGSPVAIVGVLRDVTDEHRAAEYLEAERAVVGLLDGDGEGVVPAVLETLSGRLGYELAELWLLDGGGEHLRPSEVWRHTELPVGEFDAAREGLAFEIGDGLAGQAWARRTPTLTADLGADPLMPRRAEAARDGLRSALALPLVRDREVLGVIVLCAREPREIDGASLRVLEGIGGHVAEHLARRGSARRIAAQAADLAVLSRVAHDLAARADMEAARLSICRAAAEVAGGACALLWEADGDALMCSASTGARATGDRIPLDHEGGAAGAFAAAEPLLLDSAKAGEWGRAGLASGYWQPVVHDGRAIGVLAVGWSEPPAAVTDHLRSMLALLAAEAAVAIDRARLLERLDAAAA